MSSLKHCTRSPKWASTVDFMVETHVKISNAAAVQIWVNIKKWQDQHKSNKTDWQDVQNGSFTVLNELVIYYLEVLFFIFNFFPFIELMLWLVTWEWIYGHLVLAPHRHRNGFFERSHRHRKMSWNFIPACPNQFAPKHTPENQGFHAPVSKAVRRKSHQPRTWANAEVKKMNERKHMHDYQSMIIYL